MDAAIIAEKVVYDRWYKFLRLDLRMPDGAVVERHLLHHGHAVCVLPYDPKRRVATVVRMPRAALVRVGEPPLIEAIAGSIERGRSKADQLRLEAMEEAGLRLTQLESVVNIWSAPTFATERVELFLAEYNVDDRLGQGGGATGEHENIEWLELPLATLARQADEGRLIDAKTLILLLSLRLRRPELFVDCAPCEPLRERGEWVAASNG